MTYDQRAELAQAIHRKTDNGNKIVDFLNDVLDQNLPDVRLTHRLQSARLLTKYGQFPDAERFIERHANKRGRKKSGRQQKELSGFDAALQKVILAEINPASTAQWLIDVMQGRTPAIEAGLDTFKPHHRMSAVRELLARGYDNDYTFTPDSEQPSTDSSRYDSRQLSSDISDDDVMRAKAGVHSAGQSGDPRDSNHIELETEKSEPAEEPIDLVAIAMEINASLDPSEFTEEPPSSHKPNYTMWDIIDRQPEPIITKEHARIGAALFQEAIERQILWEESNVKIPTRKDQYNYDDG